MIVKDSSDFPTLFGERLSSIICEDVKDFLREVSEYTTRLSKELRETQEERDDLLRELDRLREEKEAIEADAQRRLGAIPVDILERLVKSCDSMTEVHSFYEKMLEYAEGKHGIKPKPANVKAQYKRRKKPYTQQVFKNCKVVQKFKSKETRIDNPTFGSMYDIHDNHEVNAR